MQAFLQAKRDLLRLTPAGIWLGAWVFLTFSGCEKNEPIDEAKAAGKTNLEFRYFDGLDHGLGTIEYFITGKPSTGYVAIFEFMKRFAQR